MDLNLSNAPWLSRRPENRGDAYYFSLDHTGVPAIDCIVGAIAWAGKCAHSTEDWTREHVGWIDAALKSAAAQLAAVTAQRDELLRAAVKVLNTSPRTSSSNPRELDHMDACTDLGVAVERIARAHPEQPPQPKEEP